MAEALEIVDFVVRAAPTPFSAAAGGGTGFGGTALQTVELNVRVRNSSSGPLYVVSDLRALDFDAALRRVFVGFCEPAPAPESSTIHVRKHPPRVVALGAGESLVLHTMLPATIHKLRAQSGLGLATEQLQIRDAIDLEVTVASSDQPFTMNAEEASTRMVERLRSWSRLASFRRDLSSARGEERPQ